MKSGRTKVLFVCGSLSGGGAEKILAYLLNHFDPQRYELRLVLLERQMDYLSEIRSGIPIDCLDKTPRWGMVQVVFKLRRVLREYRPQAVISVLNYVNIVTMLAKLLSGVRTRTILGEHLHLHNYFPGNARGFLKKQLMRFTFNRADAIVSVSRSIQQDMEAHYGIEPGRIQVIYNPIPIDEVVGKSQAKISHPFFRNGKHRVVISAGRLVKQKRFDRLLRAFALAKARRPELRLIILGKGELEQTLKQLARELGVDREVDFAGFKEKPSAWMAKADMFVMSSEREGFPNVLIEAMACGVPVISTDCLSGPSEIIQNRQNGLLVPEDQPEALVEAILTLAGDAALRKKFSQAGRKFAEQFRVEKVLPLYERLCSEQTPAHGRRV